MSRFRPGDRIVYVTKGYGGYASRRLVPARAAPWRRPPLWTIRLGGLLHDGLTVGTLAERHERLAAGGAVLVQATAGGVGQLLCQWAAHLSCRVIGTVGSPEKVETTRRAGCSEVIDCGTRDFVAATLDLTGGTGVDLVYDAVGRGAVLHLVS